MSEVMKYSRIILSFAATTAMALSCAAFAQSGGEVIARGGVLPAAMSAGLDPADRLASSLRLLSQNPYDVTALTQAGESALAVGDANAAISFLARAEELNPGSGRIKASLASALVMVERPTEAFRLFREATALGVPDHQIAKDRGLAYDLTGDSRRAQKDYTISLRHGGDEEVTRRMALSLGIAGDKDDALKVLEPLIRRNDQAAWRARAFVLAMNGDMKAAEKIAEQTSSGGTLTSMSQFMRRLAVLTPAQRAFAVNFGSMPATEIRMASAQITDPFRPIGDGAASILTPVNDPPISAPAVFAAVPERTSKAARRRPGRDEVAPVPTPTRAIPEPVKLAVAELPKPSWSTERVSRRIGARIGPVDPNSIPDVLKPKPVADRNNGPRMPELVKTDLTVLPAPMSSSPRIEGEAPVARDAGIRLGSVDRAKLSVILSQAPPKEIVPVPVPVPATAIAAAAIAPVSTAGPSPVQTFGVSAAETVLATPTAGQQAALFEIPSATQQVVAVVETPLPVTATPALVMPVAAGLVVAGPVLAGPGSLSTSLPSTPMPVAAAVPPTPGFSEAVIPAAIAVERAPLMTNAVLQGVAEAPAPAVAPSPMVQAIPSAPEGLVSVLSSIELEAESSGGPVMSDTEFRKARLAAKRKAEAQEAKLVEADAATKLKTKEEEEKRRISAANPARLWVQVATGANESGLSRTLSKVREQAPVALKGVGGASVPFKSTNRVLVGPFKSASEARAMLSKLTKAGVAATTYSSTAGQEVSKLPSR